MNVINAAVVKRCSIFSYFLVAKIVASAEVVRSYSTVGVKLFGTSSSEKLADGEHGSVAHSRTSPDLVPLLLVTVDRSPGCLSPQQSSVCLVVFKRQ